MWRAVLQRGLQWLPLILGLAVAAGVLQGFLGRLGHPYDLEWMEGGMVAHAWRLQQGLPLYPEPGPDFVPFIYPPGYPAVLALVGAGGELSLPLGRAISVLSTLGAAMALILGVMRQGRSLWAGTLAAAIFLGTWPDSGTFFDLARPDALSLSLLATAIIVGMERHPRAPMLAGWLLAGAYLCKHNAAAFGLPMLLGIWARDGGRGAGRFALHAIGPALGATAALQGWTEGRFLTYLLGVPSSHPLVGARMVPGLLGELGHALGWAVAGLALFVGLRARAVAGARWAAVAGLIGGAVGAIPLALTYPRGVIDPGPVVLGLTSVALGAGLAMGAVGLGRAVWTRRPCWEWVYGGGIGGMALLTAALMRGHHGGFLNVLMPLHWVLALAVGMALARARARWTHPVAGVVLALGLSAQLLTQYQRLDLDAWLPTEADRAAGDAVVQILRERCPGPVLSPYAAWLPAQAGGEPSVHLMALWDIVHHETTPFPELQGRMQQAMEAQRWVCIVEGGRDPIRFGMLRHYDEAARFPIPRTALVPKVGWRVRPSALYLPTDSL